MDRGTLAERARTALTEAERIKAKIGSGTASGDGADGHGAAAEETEWSGIGGYLSSALTGWRSRENSSRSVGNDATSQAASEEEDAGKRRKKQDKKSTSLVLLGQLALLPLAEGRRLDIVLPIRQSPSHLRRMVLVRRSARVTPVLVRRSARVMPVLVLSHEGRPATVAAPFLLLVRHPRRVPP